jgi:hypothetical protein
VAGQFSERLFTILHGFSGKKCAQVQMQIEKESPPILLKLTFRPFLIRQENSAIAFPSIFAKGAEMDGTP